MRHKQSECGHRAQGDGPKPGRLVWLSPHVKAVSREDTQNTCECHMRTFKVPDGLPDDKALFLSDIFPTGYMAAENADIEPGDTVAVWGCGPVAQFAIQSAWMLGAGRVIAIDMVPERLRMAEEKGRAETIDFGKEKVQERLMEMTKGRGSSVARGSANCADAGRIVASTLLARRRTSAVSIR